MSSAAAEAAINMDCEAMLDLAPVRSGSGESSRRVSWATENVETPDTTADLKKGYFFDDQAYGDEQLKPSTSHDREQQDGPEGLFDSLAVLEKGDGGLAPGEEPLAAAPTFTVTPFVLSEPVSRREGGWIGWTCVAGSWLILFATSGYANAFGVFQAHYQFFGYPTESPSSISWIGSIQWFLQFSAGIVAGPLYDRGYFNALVTGGGIIYIISLFMTSLCQELWQTILAQAVGTGLGLGLVYLPALSVLSEHFYHRRALAMGIAQTGACVGGVVIPIMLNNLMSTHPFKQSVQYTAYLLLGCLLVGTALMRPMPKAKVVRKNSLVVAEVDVHPATADVTVPTAQPALKSLFKSKSYDFLVAGLCLTCLGVFFPSFYLQIFASEKGVDKNLTSYTVAIINAASTIGRLASAVGDIYGPLNLLVGVGVINAVLCFCVFGAATEPGLVLVAVIYGISSGVFNSVMAPAIMSLARNKYEIGSRLGVGFLICGFGALGGTPVIGLLLEKTGWIGPVMFSGAMTLSGSVLVGIAVLYQRKEKATWRV